jgi:hypothetical protein
MAPNLLSGTFCSWSVIIPDNRHPDDPLKSIAAIQKRLQDALDERRRLRRSIDIVSRAAEEPELGQRMPDHERRQREPDK